VYGGGSSGGPDKIGFTSSPTLQSTTCNRPVVFQPLGAPNLRSSWPCSNTRLNSLKNTTIYQQSTHNSKCLMHNKERSLNKSKRLKHNKEGSLNNKKLAAYEQLREIVMNIATQSGTCAPNPFWPYNHQPPPLPALPLY